jgi:transposase
MTATQFHSTIIPRDYDIFIGLDVDKKKMAVTCLDHGTLQKSLSLPYSGSQLLNYTNKHFAGQRIAFVYEAGPTGFGLHDELTAAQHPCLVVTPAMVPSAPRKRVKTNRLDSKKLALELRGGKLEGIHVPTQTYRELRQLVQLRDTQAAQVRATKCRIKSLLLFEGLPFPEAREQWTVAALKDLERLPCNATVRFKLDRLMDALQFHYEMTVTVQKKVRRFCNDDPELRQSIRLLRTISGVGTITATHAVARLGDWRLIKNDRQIAGFLGLVSSDHSTCDKENRGQITRIGDQRLRNKLIQCAWSAIKKDPELRAFYRRIYARHPKKLAARKAIVAVARKLTTRIYAVLKNQRPYEIRADVNTAPLTIEETIGLRERLDMAQNDEL